MPEYPFRQPESAEYPFCHIPEHGGFIAQEASIRRGFRAFSDFCEPR